MTHVTSSSRELKGCSGSPYLGSLAHETFRASKFQLQEPIISLRMAEWRRAEQRCRWCQSWQAQKTKSATLLLNTPSGYVMQGLFKIKLPVTTKYSCGW